MAAVPRNRMRPLNRFHRRQSAKPGASSKPISDGPVRERVKASPLARKTARDLSIDLALVHGTGPAGQIKQRDVLAFQEKGYTMPAVLSSPGAPTLVSQTKPTAPSLEGAEVEISRMRKTIARRTVQSVQTSPHFYVT